MMLRSSWLLIATLLLAFPAASADLDAVVGSEGELYRVIAGTYGELFPDGTVADPAHPVLVIDVSRPGEGLERILVPDTEGEESEGAPTVVFEDSQNVLFLVWESKLLPTVSRINLVWYQNGAFSEVVEASGDVRPLKGSPQLAITRDRVEFQPDADTTVSLDRSVLHVAWWEQAVDSEEVYYTPIVLEQGAYVGTNPVVSLSALDPNPLPAEPVAISASLSQAPTVDSGRNERAVVLGFANPATERFLSYEIQVLPGEVSQLGSLIRDFVFDHEALYTPADLPELAQLLEQHVADSGQRFNPTVVEMLADKAAAELLSIGALAPGGAGEVADRVGGHIIDLAGGVSADAGLAMLVPPEMSLSLVVAPTDPAATLNHHFLLRIWGDRTVPEIGEGTGAVRIVASEDARETLVAWEEDEALAYRESEGRDGWSEIRRIGLGDDLDAEAAFEIVRRRVREQ